MSETEPTANPRRRAALLGAIIVASLIGCAVVLATGTLTPETLQQHVADSGWRGMLLYVLLVVVMELLWLPRMWTLFASGALFGPFVGIGLSLLSDTCTAFICYGIARSAGRPFAERLVARRERARRIVHLLAHKRGGTTVAVLRVVPIAHYTLVSYLAGLTGVPPRHFLVGNTIGLLPSAVIYATVGASALDPTSPMFLISAGVLVAAFVVTTLAGRRLLKNPDEDADEQP